MVGYPSGGSLENLKPSRSSLNTLSAMCSSEVALASRPGKAGELLPLAFLYLPHGFRDS